MTPGRLQKRRADQTVVEATVSPVGWECSNEQIATNLNLTYPVGNTAAGYGWVSAFWLAVEDLDAEVITEPVVDSAPPGTIF